MPAWDLDYVKGFCSRFPVGPGDGSMGRINNFFQVQRGCDSRKTAARGADGKKRTLFLMSNYDPEGASELRLSPCASSGFHLSRLSAVA